MKHDIEANWIIAGNATNPFVPKPGELIIYDVDDSHDSPRIKIGDGDNNVNELPFFVDETKADKDEILDENGTLKNDVLPTGYPYISQGVIIEETVAIEESGEGLITNEFQLIKDERYIVTWNGVEYNCIAKSYILDGVETIVLGNIAAFDENEEPTDEPFMIGAFPESAVAEIGGYGAILSLDGSTEVVISIYGNIIKKISKEFLPNIPNINNIVDGSQIGSVRTILTYDIIGYGAHAEGSYTTASGYYSHAEGSETTASGERSHAEGYDTTASGASSHAEGNNTIASGDNQHVQGQYNIEDINNQYAHIVGNGSSDSARSNAHTLDWDGNAWFAGDVYVGSTSGKNKDEGSKKLVTEAELASLIAQITEAVSQKSQVQLITWEDDD